MQAEAPIGLVTRCEVETISKNGKAIVRVRFFNNSEYIGKIIVPAENYPEFLESLTSFPKRMSFLDLGFEIRTLKQPSQ